MTVDLGRQRGGRGVLEILPQRSDLIVAGMDDGAMTGFAAQSFVSLSLEPPLIAVCPAKSSTSWPRIRNAGSFCINVLADDQRPVSEVFAQSGQVANIGWRPGVSGAPILDDVLAYVDCTLEAEHDAGDHPLLFFRGGYGGFLETGAR